jgi:hypothetical protein
LLAFTISTLVLACSGSKEPNASASDSFGSGASAETAFVEPSSCQTGAPGRLSEAVNLHTNAQDWIAYSEGRGRRGQKAHTLERHVGKDTTWLSNRIARERKIPAASSFPDAATAERFIGVVLRNHKAEIEEWLANPGDRSPQRQFVDGCDGVCGERLARGAGQSAPVNEATTFLVKECLADGMSFFVMTAFPGKL